MTEIDYIIGHFEEHFYAYTGRRIALYSGEYLETIIRNFDHVYHFCCILEPGSTQVPDNTDLVILTDHREGKEPDYNCICRSCEERGVLLFDLFGLDQIRLHRELKEQKYLTISEWKDVLSGYDVVSVFIPWTAADYDEQQDRWLIRRRFLILYNWMVNHGKSMVFIWDKKAQADSLKEEGIDAGDCLFIERKGKDWGLLQLRERYPDRNIIHIGLGTVKDGIVPREYGMDSRLIRYYSFSDEIPDTGQTDSFCADRKQLQEMIDCHDIISFDIFDTLLKRIVLYPRDIFDIIETRTGIKGFADCRYRIQTACPHYSLNEIYGRLKEECGYDDETAERLLRTELKTESDNILPRSSMIEIFDYALCRNKTVILFSDMYLDEAWIRQLLEKNGITGYSAVFISYQYKMLKHEGLFEIAAKMTESGRTVLHIGDNYFSDYISAREFGLDAFHVPGCLDMAVKNGYERAVMMCRTLADRKILGLGIALGFDDPFFLTNDRLIADLIVAPLTMGYMQWVCRELADKKTDLYLLSARDGKILLDLYRRLRKLDSDRLAPVKYFYVSRHAVFLTVMDDPELVNCFIHLSDYDDDPPELLRRIFRLPSDKLMEYHGESAEEYCHLHDHLIREKANQYREYYYKYLVREDIQGKRCAFMDFVSEGSCQIMLEKHVMDKMDGFYIGIPEYVSRYSPNIRYYLDQDLMDYATEMKIEVYFTSMEPALDHIGRDGEPVFAYETRNREVLNRIGKVHEQVRHYQDMYLDHLYDPGDAADKDLIFELCKTIDRYKVDNYYYDDMSGKIIGTKE